MAAVRVIAGAAAAVRTRKSGVARASSTSRVADAPIATFGVFLRASYATRGGMQGGTLAVLFDVDTDTRARFSRSQRFGRVV